MKITSAYANKLLRQLSDEKEYWLDKEQNSCFYQAAIDETPVIPEYDYEEIAGKIAEIDAKTCRIKHAVNRANVSSVLNVNGKEMTVDTILIAMSQLNRRKSQLDTMRKHLPKQRVDTRYYRSGNRSPEYEYINYDLNLVKAQYEQINKEIMDMQMVLDIHNQTFEFEVEVYAQ